jgi:hypothetical protein
MGIGSSGASSGVGGSSVGVILDDAGRPWSLLDGCYCQRCSEMRARLLTTTEQVSDNRPKSPR